MRRDESLRETLRPKTRLWAYLNATMPIEGAAELFEQKRIVDAIAASAGRSIDRYIIDSGSAVTADGRGARLAALPGEALALDHETTVVVCSLALLATTQRGRRRALAALLSAGFAIKDKTGSLQPSPNTVALARAATSQSANKRQRTAARGDDND